MLVVNIVLFLDPGKRYLCLELYALEGHFSPLSGTPLLPGPGAQPVGTRGVSLLAHAPGTWQP